MQEAWKNIEGSEIHQISNLGRVRSLNYSNTGKVVVLKTKLKKRYAEIGLNSKGKRKSHLVHRLVAKAFIPNPNNYPCVNHKDENPFNNNVNNLEWCTVAYNNSYGSRLERMSNTKKGHEVSKETREKLSKSLKKYHISKKELSTINL